MNHANCAFSIIKQVKSLWKLSNFMSSVNTQEADWLKVAGDYVQKMHIERKSTSSKLKMFSFFITWRKLNGKLYWISILFCACIDFYSRLNSCRWHFETSFLSDNFIDLKIATIQNKMQKIILFDVTSEQIFLVSIFQYSENSRGGVNFEFNQTEHWRDKKNPQFKLSLAVTWQKNELNSM